MMVTKYSNIDWEKRSTETATNYGACSMPIVVWVNSFYREENIIISSVNWLNGSILLGGGLVALEC